MAETPSNMIHLGFTAPEFQLLDVRTDLYMSLSDLKSPIATVVIFTCNHCPYVKHILPMLLQKAREYMAKDIQFIAINSNDVEKYPADSPDKMREEALMQHFPFPYLFDETQEVAKAYYAACTPDFYIFDGNLTCVYRGRFDGATPGNQQPVTGQDLCLALDQLLAGEPVTADQKPSLGCNIKWKK